MLHTGHTNWRSQLYRVIYGIDTFAGRAFDAALIFSILASSFLLIIDSVQSINAEYGAVIALLQNVFLLIFTVEYLLRIVVAPSVPQYVFSLYGIIDFLSIFPAYVGFFVPQGKVFIVIRTLRMLRLFSVFKMGRYVSESGALWRALRASKAKITVFLITILFIVVIVGAFMHVIEGPENGFTNIPQSMYWAVVTVSTVGYGDISPQTELGKLVASVLMLLGYGVIAVPTGIITSELTRGEQKPRQKSSPCPSCGHAEYAANARFCNQCGEELGEG